MKTSLIGALFASTFAFACGGHPPPPSAHPAPITASGSDLPPSTKAETKADPTFASCHNGYKPASEDKDVAADLDAMTKGCTDVTKMTKSGDTRVGELHEGGAPAFFPFSAQAGKCYRIYGMAQSTMQDFDISWLDSSGAFVAGDTTDDVSPVVSEDGKVCFKTADTTSIRATAGAGAGKFALQVWSD